MVRTAKSRQPVALARSQLPSRRATLASSIAFGREASRQAATEATAEPSATAVWPSTWRKRSRQRNRVTMHLAEPTLLRRHSASTNSLTAPGVSF